MKPTTVMKVPSTKGGTLLNQLDKAEELMTKVFKYTVKYVEQGGIPLALMFNTNITSGKCGREECMVCKLSRDGKKSGCTTKSMSLNASYAKTLTAIKVSIIIM